MSEDKKDKASGEPRIRTNEDGSKTIQLSRPITVAGEKTFELTVQEPCVKHLEKLDGVRFLIGPSGLEFDKLGSVVSGLIQDLCGLTPGEAKQIRIADMPDIMVVLADFFGLTDLIGGMP